MVFDDRTDAVPDDEGNGPKVATIERTVSQPMDLARLQRDEATIPEPGATFDEADVDDFDAADPPTIIDQDLSREVLDALAPPPAKKTDPNLDARLANVPVGDVGAAGNLDAAPERTVRTASPFEVRVTPVVQEFDETDPVPNVEKTQKARIPYDLKAEHTLPPTANRAGPKVASPVDPPPVPEVPDPALAARPSGSTRSGRPASQRERPRKRHAPNEPEAAPPKAPARARSPAKGLTRNKRPLDADDARERTSIDIAAALGMAPEPSPAPREDSPPPASKNDELRLPDRNIDLGLDDPEPKRAKGTPGPREGLRSDQIAGLAESTGRLSKIIPIALGMLVLLATIAISLQLFERRERQEHVELRFMGIGNDDNAVRASEVGTPVVIETEPPGLLVMFERNVIGKTPLQATVPVDLEDKIVVELVSPYFERWLGEVRRGPAGDYTINVNLARRERR